MSSEIKLRDAGAPADPDANLDLRWENVTNSPIVSVTDLDAGQLIADVYELAFTKTGGAFTVDVVCNEGTKNPYGGTGISVTADGSTSNVTIVPGCSIVLSASIVTGWAARVTVGAYMNGSAVVVDALNVGIVEAGESTAAYKVIAENVGADTAAGSSIIAVPGTYWTQSGTGNIVSTIRNHPSATRERSASPRTYTITFAAWQDGTGDNAGYKTCNILVGGVVCVTTARFDGTTKYGYGLNAAYNDGTDLLQGLYITLANDTDDPSAVTITLIVAEGYEDVWLAPDESGTPGAYQQTALTLTESGQTSGTIRASHGADFWFKWVLPDDETPGAIRLFRLRCRNLTV